MKKFALSLPVLGLAFFAASAFAGEKTTTANVTNNTGLTNPRDARVAIAEELDKHCNVKVVKFVCPFGGKVTFKIECEQNASVKICFAKQGAKPAAGDAGSFDKCKDRPSKTCTLINGQVNNIVISDPDRFGDKNVPNVDCNARS
jgi:hypothetical protein